MRTRIIHTKFWTDNYISSLKHKEKLLFIYLITNDKVNLCGIYELPDKHLEAILDLTTKELKQMKQKLQKDRRFIFYEGWIRIINIEKYNQYIGEKNEVAKNRELSFVPKEILEYPMDRVSIGYPGLQDTPINKKSEIRNKKSEIRKGVVKGKNRYSCLKSLKEIDLIKIAKKYDVPLNFVKVVFDRMENWCKSKGRSYKNYQRALMNWVSKSKEEKLEGRWQNDKKKGIDATNL